MVSVGFDVDDTLICHHVELIDIGDKKELWVRTGEITPNYPMIEFFKQFERIGCHMIIWSSGGTDYAKEWAEKLGLKAEIRPKEGFEVVDIAVDDQEVFFGRVNLKVEDNHARRI